MRTRARRTEQDVAALRADVSDLRNLATARLRVIDDLSEKVVELEAVVDSLNTELARHIEFHPSPVAAVVDLAPVSDDVELGPPYDAGQPEPAAEEPDPEPAAEPQLTDEQAALVAAVKELQEASTGEIARHVGRADQADAVGVALAGLRKRCLVGHNGRRAKGARWLALSHEPAPPPPASADPLEVSALDERIIRLVEQHGPCTHVYVADNLVKNRRETGARMRELARNGLLVDLDGAFATPALAAAARDLIDAANAAGGRDQLEKAEQTLEGEPDRVDLVVVYSIGRDPVGDDAWHEVGGWAATAGPKWVHAALLDRCAEASASSAYAEDDPAPEEPE